MAAHRIEAARNKLALAVNEAHAVISPRSYKNATAGNVYDQLVDDPALVGFAGPARVASDKQSLLAFLTALTAPGATAAAYNARLGVVRARFPPANDSDAALPKLLSDSFVARVTKPMEAVIAALYTYDSAVLRAALAARVTPEDMKASDLTVPLRAAVARWLQRLQLSPTFDTLADIVTEVDAVLAACVPAIPAPTLLSRLRAVAGPMGLLDAAGDTTPPLSVWLLEDASVKYLSRALGIVCPPTATARDILLLLEAAATKWPASCPKATPVLHRALITARCETRTARFESAAALVPAITTPPPAAAGTKRGASPSRPTREVVEVEGRSGRATAGLGRKQPKLAGIASMTKTMTFSTGKSGAAPPMPRTALDLPGLAMLDADMFAAVPPVLLPALDAVAGGAATETIASAWAAFVKDMGPGATVTLDNVAAAAGMRAKEVGIKAAMRWISSLKAYVLSTGGDWLAPHQEDALNGGMKPLADVYPDPPRKPLTNAEMLEWEKAALPFPVKSRERDVFVMAKLAHRLSLHMSDVVKLRPAHVSITPGADGVNTVHVTLPYTKATKHTVQSAKDDKIGRRLSHLLRDYMRDHGRHARDSAKLLFRFKSKVPRDVEDPDEWNVNTFVHHVRDFFVEHLNQPPEQAARFTAHALRSV